MATSLIKDQVPALDLLALYVQVDGIATDVFEAKYEIFDESAGLPGTSLKAGTVTTGTGHFATGCYGAYDSATSAAWKPTATYARARIEWRYKIASTSDETLALRAFEVVATSVGQRPYLVPALIQDVKDYASPAPTQTDKAIREAIIEWRDLIERYCRQGFLPRRQTKILTGSGSYLLQLSEPLFAAIEIKINAGTDARTLGTDFTFYGAVGAERHNPRILWKRSSSSASGSIWSPSSAGSRFATRMTQSVNGVWGFVEEETLDAPELVRKAVTRGVRLALDAEATGGSGGSPGGPIRREETDGHMIEYAVSSGSSRSGLLSILRDPIIRDALDLYRGPIQVISPGPEVEIF